MTLTNELISVQAYHAHDPLSPKPPAQVGGRTAADSYLQRRLPPNYCQTATVAGTHYHHGPTATPAAVYIAPRGKVASRYAACTIQGDNYKRWS